MGWLQLIIVGIGIAVWVAVNLREKPKPNVKPAPADKEERRPDGLREFLADVRRQMEGGPAKPPPLPVEFTPPPRQEAPRSKKRRKSSAPPERPKVGTEPPPPISVNVQMPAMPAMETPALANVRRPNAAARDAIRLLKSKSTMATAIVLHEVLGPPLAKRRGWRGPAAPSPSARR